MKIDKSKIKKGLSEVPGDCKQLIDHLKSCSEDELNESLKNIKSWNYGKCELYHWVDVLDYFDSIMERCVHKEKEGQWTLPCDLPENEKDKDLLINIIIFTSLLIEHSFSKHVYSSMEHLTTLLASSDMQIVLAVLNLLYVFSKRSNFISRLSPEKKLSLLSRLNHLADSWGGKENGFGLAECCQNLDRSSYPPSATTLHFEFYNDETTNTVPSKEHPHQPATQGKANSKSATILNTIHIDNVDQITNRTLAELMEELIATHNVPKEKQMLLFTHLRLAHYFSTYRKRLQCVQARLQALSIIVYSNAMTLQENFNVLYNGFIEELVEVLELKDNHLLEIKAAAIRTLTSVIHLDHTTKLNSIIDITGASSYHGFLPSLVRSCIQALIDNNTQQYTLPFATALFSFLYHLSNYEAGGEALVSCGMIDSLLKVISWKGTDSDHITFVTRAVRVIDLITNLEMAAFHTHADLNVFIDRLEYDVDMCRKDQPFEIEIKSKRRDSQDLILSELEAGEQQQTSMEVDNEVLVQPGASSAGASASSAEPTISAEEQVLIDRQLIQKQQQLLASGSKELQCYPQRAAVLKSILNFLKKAIQDAAFSDSIRHLMDGSLPKSLKHIISNAEYYGPSLFMLATDVVTVYVFQEPSLLSSLQENGLTDVILHALLTKDIPATKEVLAALPNVFSALCLNSRGLESFKSFRPFDKIFKVLLSPDYLPAMRRRRSTDPMGETSINLGASMDELMRHLPSLKQSAIAAIINLLKELCKLGSDPDTVCSSKLPFKTANQLAAAEGAGQARASTANRSANVVQADGGNSSGDDEEEEEDTNPSNNAVVVGGSSGAPPDNLAATVDNLNQNSNNNGTNIGSSQLMSAALTNSNSNNNLINQSSSAAAANKQQVVPLVDYILHVMKFLEAILSNNNTDDHCREFVLQKGLEPLLQIFQLPNLPIDFPLSQACFSLGNVCKSILSLSQEKEVLKQGLVSLQKVLDKLRPLHVPLDQPGGSVLLEELVKASELCANLSNCDPLQSAALTPLLHNLSAAHAYIAMFIILSRCSHNEVRNICITHWGSELGQNVLKELGQLYTSLVWESTILLAFCSDTGYLKFGQTQLERLAALSKENNSQQQPATTANSSASTSVENSTGTLLAQPSGQQPTGDAAATVAATASSNQMDIDESTQFNVEESIEKTKQQVEVAQAILNNCRPKTKSNNLSPETKQIKALLTSASRLGRALAELFNHLVKLSVNSPLRQRRNHTGIVPVQTSPSVVGVANSLTKLITSALSWIPPISPTPKFRLTFYICCVGFTSPLLFDERKHPYHLMLQSFVANGGQEAFFETFRWALTQGGKVPIEEGLEHPNLPEGVGEFLDSWLMLLEKMVNPKMVLESPHTIQNDPSTLASSSKQPQPTFDPIKYLQQIHKKTFDCIMHLWNRKPLKLYGEHISETILVILCHLLRGETIIVNKMTKDLNDYAKNLESRGGPSTAADPAAPRNQFSAARSSGGLQRSNAVRHHRDRASIEENEYNRTQIQQLVDMGFAREAAIDAFLHTSTLEQATDYLLTHTQNSQDWEMSEDDQVLRAIEISLADNAQGEQQQPAAASGEANAAASGEVNAAAGAEGDAQAAQTATTAAGGVSVSTLITTLIDQQLAPNVASTITAPPTTATTSGQTTTASSNTATESKHTGEAQPSTSTASKDQPGGAPESYEPLSKELMDSLTNSLLSGCLKLLDTLPQTVHRVCDILLAVSQRNGEEWTKKILQELIDQIFECVNKLLDCSKPLTSSDRKSLIEWAAQMSQIPEASKAASRIHLFSLLFEEKKNECAQYVEESNLIGCLITLLDSAQDILLLLKSKYSNSTNNKMITPKWLAPVILLIDLYDKAAIASKRKAPLLNMPARQWKYFEERTGKWAIYQPKENKIIDDAYCNGENLVRFYSGRRKYCIQFPIMLQVNEDNVNYRPIMFVAGDAKSAESAGTPQDGDTAMDLADDSTAASTSKVEQPSASSQAASLAISKYRVIKELDAQQNLNLITSCVSFLSIPVDVEALQAVMRLILRITRDYEMAKKFAELGGVKSILKLTQQSEFTEFISLATLIIRHVFEDPATLRQTMEKVLRALWVSSVNNYKEMHYQLRIFGPAACRNSEMLSEIATNIFRIQFNSIVTKKEDEDLRMLQPNAVQLLRLLPSKSASATLTPTDTIREVISDLLNALTVKSTITEDDLLHSIYKINQNIKTKLESMDTNEPSPANAASNVEPGTEQMQTEQSEQQAANAAASSAATASKLSTKTTVFEDSANSVWRKEDLLFTQSVIMRILAELVKSYNVVPKLITDHQFSAGQSEYVQEDCSALAFILDNLLPNNQFVGDRDSPALARLLIVALASSMHSQDAQVQLVSEVKAALLRALNLSESNEKHLRIQALTGIINTMIDSYSSLQNGTSTAGQNLHLRNLTSGLNSIIFRKGLFIDLARVSHSLDLSSPHMAVTINTVLKPLETLSRAIHHPPQMLLNQKKGTAATTTGGRLQSGTQQQPQSNAGSAAAQSEQPANSGESSANNQNEMSVSTREDQPQRDNAASANDDSQLAPPTTSAGSAATNQTGAQDNCSTPVSSGLHTAQEGLNILNSLLMDVNEAFDTHNQASGSALRSNVQVNDSVETVSVVEPMMDDQIVADEYDPSSQPPQDASHMININAIETETEDSEEIDEDEDDEDEGEDAEDDDVNENEDNSAAEDEEDEDHGEDDGESDGDDEEISFATQGQELEDFVRYAVTDELMWELDENSPRIISHGTPYRFNDFVHLLESEQHTNGADASQPIVPPAPGTVSALHPLLSRNTGDNVYSVNSASQNQFNSSILPRGFRSSRQRLHRSSQLPQSQSLAQSVANMMPANAHLPTLHNAQQNWQSTLTNLHLSGVNHSNSPPIFLQGLLGPTNRQNFIQLTRAAVQQPTRFTVYAPNDYQLFTTNNWTDGGQIGPESSDGSMLNSIATAITRWTEESKVLDGDSIHDCVANLKPAIIAEWEKHRDEELNERKEKRKEMIEKDRKNEAQRADSKSQQPEATKASAGQSTTTAPVEESTTVEETSGQPAATGTQPATTESEQMEVQTTVVQTTSEASSSAPTSSVAQPDEVIEMTCSETISTEQEMEVSNTSATTAPTTSASNEEAMNTPAASVDVSSDQQSSTAAVGEQQASASASTTNNEQQASNSAGGEEIPEGIDPSFLAALPENIRQEVIAEQLRLQRLQQRTAAAAASSNSNNAQQASSSSNANEISPEFLAALPPGIQEEVIAQHSNEQRNAASSNPDSPVDPTDFIQTLPLQLRRQVLTDLDDSLLALLPNYLVNEAQMLREELEARHRHIQERFLTSHATHALSRILRNTSVRGLGSGNQRYTIQVPHGSFVFPFGSNGRGGLNSLGGVDSSNAFANANVRGGNHAGCLLNSKLRCKQLLDNEALSCLLILLFVDEPKLNITRLHRVLRNLCNHIPTRQWIIQSLLSIMEKAKEGKYNQLSDDSSVSANLRSKKNSSVTISNNQTSWLSISMDAALGCRTDVFQIQRSNNSSKSYQISINPQAAHIVCRHVLDTLISLAKSFPYQFLPDTFKDPNELKSALQTPAGSSSKDSKDDANKVLNKDYDFWDVLVKLDSQNAGGRSNATSGSGKGSKSQTKHNTSMNSSALNQSVASEHGDGQLASQSSTLAQIISLLAHPVIKRNSLLTDKLLRLLSLLAKSLPPEHLIVQSSTAASASNQSEPTKPAAAQATKSKEKEERKSSVGEEQLRLAVEVLTSKSCSEEGLEDATSLLLRLSQNDPVIRDIVLKLLLQGARQLGQTVCQHINNLSEELKRLNLDDGQPSTSGEQDDDKFSKSKRVKGVIQDRFTKNPILIAGTSNKHNPSIREVQLPSMTALTCKTSSQSFFLRILKVIIQLRESIKVAANRGATAASASRPTRENTAAAAAAAAVAEEDNKSNDQMEIDKEPTASTSAESEESKETATLSNQLQLNDLWESLSDCLLELANAPDHHAVLVLQPAVEAFFFVHACEKDQNKRTADLNNPLLDSRDNLLASQENPADADLPAAAAANANKAADPASQLLNDSMVASGHLQSGANSSQSKDTQKFLQFAETHKVVLNQILRQSTTPLSEGPFSVLVDHTRVLDFDVKRRYFRTELDLLDEGGRREDLAVHVRRDHVFEDSFRELYRRSSEEWKNRFYIVFENEEGQDAGGLLREWYTIISREIFNPNYALFCVSPGDRVTYMINSSSHCNSNHLQYFKFVGRVIAKAIYDNKLLDSYFTRSFYKHILGRSVKYTDMESEDYTFYQSLVHFLEHDVNELGLDLTFSIEVQEFGVTEVRDLKENGRNLPVTEENKHEYVRLVCQEKMTYSIKKQLSAFLEGFYEIIPKRLISIFNEQELELLISGLPTIDIDDLKANTEYHKYQANSLQIQWFWRALRSFDQADRAKFLQFVTGTSKVPLQGFSTLEGMNGTQKFQIHKEDRSTDRLPSAHTCFNQLDLPVYETYDKLRQMLLKAIHECSEGFGFA